MTVLCCLSWVSCIVWALFFQCRLLVVYMGAWFFWAFKTYFVCISSFCFNFIRYVWPLQSHSLCQESIWFVPDLAGYRSYCMGSDLESLLQFCHGMLNTAFGALIMSCPSCCLAAEWGIVCLIGNSTWYFLEMSNSASDGSFGVSGVVL